MMSAGVADDVRQWQRCVLIQPKDGVSASQRSQLAVSTASCPHGEGLPLPKMLKKAILASRLPGIWGMSAEKGG
jgi:hypothetical protein